MSYKIVLSVTPGVQVTQPLQSVQNIQAVKVTNGTPFDLDYTGVGSATIVVVPAGLEYMFYASQERSGQIQLLAVNNNNQTGTGVVNVTVFLEGDQIPKGTWPVTVPTQTVQAKVSTVTTLINDGNSTGTQIIESTPAGAPGSTISILNNGTIIIKGDVSGTLTTLLQLISANIGSLVNADVKISDAGSITEILGKLLVDSTLTVNNFLLTNTIADNVVGNDQIDLAAAGITINKILTLAVGLTSSGGGFTVDASGNLVGHGLIITAGNFQVDSSGNVTIQGTLKMFGNQLICSTNAAIIDASSANDLFLNPPNNSAGHIVALATAGVERFEANDSGAELKSGTFHFLAGSISRTWGGNVGCGSGTTISHGAGVTPDLIVATPNIAQPGSATVGIGAITSTNFRATVGAGTQICFFVSKG